MDALAHLLTRLHALSTQALYVIWHDEARPATERAYARSILLARIEGRLA